MAWQDLKIDTKLKYKICHDFEIEYTTHVWDVSFTLTNIVTVNMSNKNLGIKIDFLIQIVNDILWKSQWINLLFSSHNSK